MNLLMISGDRSIPAGRKGAFWYTLEEMSKHWERIDVICPRVKFQVSGFKLQDAFENVFFHPSPKGLWYQPLWIVAKGRELIQKHKHDVMTVHEFPPFYNGRGGKRLSKLMKIPFVLEVHHVVGYPKAANLVEFIGKHWSKKWIPYVAKSAAKIRVVSKSTEDQLMEWKIPKNKIEIVPSFYLDSEALKPDPSIQKKYDVVTCCRLVANKGLVELLEAMSLVSDARLLVIGDGPLRNSLEQKAKHLHVHDRVHFAGWLSESSDVYHDIQSAKIFVMNSRSEGGPRSALEAMALGMPVISTKVGAMTDVIVEGVNGIFTSGEKQDLASKIDSLLKYPQLSKNLGSKAEGIRTAFQRGVLIKGYADFLQDVGRDTE